jgi:hypothetical protein
MILDLLVYMINLDTLRRVTSDRVHVHVRSIVSRYDCYSQWDVDWVNVNRYHTVIKHVYTQPSSLTYFHTLSRFLTSPKWFNIGFNITRGSGNWCAVEYQVKQWICNILSLKTGWVVKMSPIKYLFRDKFHWLVHCCKTRSPHF